MKRREFISFTASGLALISAAPALAQVKKIPRSHGEHTMQIVPYTGAEKSGTIIISNGDRTLMRVLGDRKAEMYRVSIGREGFTWAGITYVGRKAEWPDWRPPSAMRQRDPSLPQHVPPGPYNPLGARAIYLFSNGQDTLYRIHGTNSAGTVGAYETSGCFRLTNADVMELFTKVKSGTKVIVY
jgi:lipoprotein-anchoring transpeptidase ErfK/SrfK